MANDDWGFTTNTSSSASDGWDLSSSAQPKNARRNLNDGFSEQGHAPEKLRGPWYWPLTLLALLIVSGLSFAIAYLLRDMPERNVLFIGLTFMVPVAAMMFTASALDARTSAMTPTTNGRGKQLAIAAIATLVTFAVGCLSDLLYLEGFVRHMPPVQNVQSNNIVFVLDKSDSMGWDFSDSSGTTKPRDVYSVNAISTILDTIPENAYIGLVLFDRGLMGEVAPSPLTPEHKADIVRGLNTPMGGGTNFDLPLIRALELYRDHMPTNGYPNEIVLVTDGESSMFRTNDILTAALDLGIKISVINISQVGVNEHLDSIVQSTGGAVYTAENYEQLESQISIIADVVIGEPEDRDLLRSSEPTAVGISAAMILLEGLAIGLCLWLLLSAHGQFRAQVILSPLMAALAFVLIKIGPLMGWYEHSWLVEGIAFSLLGIVFMRKNRRIQQTAKPAPRQQTPTQFDSFTF